MNRALRIRRSLQAFYVLFGLVSLLTGANGTYILVQFLGQQGSIPSHQYLVMGPAKVLMGLLMLTIAFVPTNGELSPPDGLSKLGAVCVLLGLPLGVVGGLIWLLLTWGTEPPFMTPAAWVFPLICIPGMMFLAAGMFAFARVVATRFANQE